MFITLEGLVSSSSMIHHVRRRQRPLAFLLFEVTNYAMVTGHISFYDTIIAFKHAFIIVLVVF